MGMSDMSANSEAQLCALLRATGTAKELGHQTGRPWRTIQRYLAGRARPDPLFLLSLMRVNDAFAAGLRRLAASLGRRFALWREDRLLLRAEWWAALARRWL